MKRQIRQGVFETNSSSEHSLSIMNRDMFILWKDGKVLARMTREEDARNCWGNFWSVMYNFEFTDDKEKAIKENNKILKKCIERGIAQENEYKSRCETYKKRIDHELTQTEINALSDEEQQKYYDDLCEDADHYFNEDHYNYWMNVYQNLNWDNFDENFNKLLERCWITYDEFMEELKVDCYSPFEHDDPVNNVHIIGKYFHS